MPINGVTIGTGVTMAPGVSVVSNYTGALVVAIQGAYGLVAWQWSDATGFGTRYTLDSGTIGQAVAFSPSGAAILSNSSSSTISAWAWSNASGFGTKYADPAVSGGNTPTRIAFSPSGAAVATSNSNSGSVSPLQAWAWSDSGGFGTKYANPSAFPTNTGSGVAFSPSGAAVALSHYNSPYITVYAWSDATGFGTKYTSPSVAGTGHGVAFSPLNDVIFSSNSTNVNAWNWNDSTGFGTLIGSQVVTTLVNTNAADVTISPSGRAVAVGTTSINGASNAASVYPFSATTGFGTIYSDPSGIPSSTTEKWVFSPLGAAIMGFDKYGAVFAFQWSDTTGFGTKYTNPSLTGITYVHDIAISP